VFQYLAELWYRPPRLAWALAPIGLLYRSTSALRYGLYRAGLLRRTRLDVPVVIVGNIAVGGTGKTPLTVWLAEHLAAAGLKPAVVCRSYAASATFPSAVGAQDDPSERGDEAVLLATRLDCPVWSGPDRAATARTLLAAHAEVDVIVCDDGLQHYALARDCEIAVVDGTRGFGNGLSLPAGPLREPPSRLRSVDAIVINGNGAAVPTPPAYRASA
jgi:tetraacyldisaccharide 4'-kinase